LKHVIALDVGGTGMKAALVAEDGSLLYEARRGTGRERGPDAVVESVLDFATELRAEGEARLGTTASAAGVAVPGVIDEKNGIAVYSSNIGWHNVPFRDLLQLRLGTVPVALGHDVRSGGLAEGRIGAARGIERFFFLALGTGIAGAIGIEGRIEGGAGGAGGEIGHILVRQDGPLCGCGAIGCLETMASATAVGRAWAAAGGGPEATAADAARAVDAGDPRAQAVWQEMVEALADGVVTGHRLLDPSVFVIGGGLAEAGDTLFTPLKAAVDARIRFQTAPALVPAQLGDAAGCQGAGLLAWDLVAAAG
jgi:glucokinase